MAAKATTAAAVRPVYTLNDLLSLRKEKSSSPPPSTIGAMTRDTSSSSSSDDGSEASFHEANKTLVTTPYSQLDSLYRDFLSAQAEDFGGDLEKYTDRLVSIRARLAIAGEEIPDRLFLKKVELGARATHSLTVNLALAICNKKGNKTSDDFVRNLLSVHKLLETDGGIPGPGPSMAAKMMTSTAGSGSGGSSSLKEYKNFHVACGKFHTGGDDKCWLLKGGDKPTPHPNLHALCGKVHVGGDDKCWVLHPELKPSSKWTGGGGKNKSTMTADSSQSPVRGGKDGADKPVVLRVDYRVL
ncbi:hypothetical protein MAPG_01009 [Magnaporthiopsis poae ATCC 64411]|uniref:Uncharacterized protein n=1 Tax=Magnaporthiopsis poae (strain ATCC 64411 / 73-15) TaxID=644358 RepID=A0A0C4DMK0_MAGP6|nr:hypothetical protein MAPG_01009 [Magnaporthiopsis poae ATCC 64411]